MEEDQKIRDLSFSEKTRAISLIVENASEMEEVGERLAISLQKGDIVLLRGRFGAGKTTLARGIVRALTGHREEVTSPSFVIVNEYEGMVPVFHFDLYRFASSKEISTIGYEEYFGKGVILIEWPERAKGIISASVEVDITYEDESSRRVIIQFLKRDPAAFFV